MKRTQTSQCDVATQLDARFKRCLALLKEGSDYAEQANCDLWDFAVEIEELRELELSVNDLRFLVRLQLLDHASELKASVTNGRRFRSTGPMHFTNRTCFVLTQTGMVLATVLVQLSWGQPPVTMPTQFRFADERDSSGALQTPTWDSQRHTLQFHGQIVKQFKWHATNQELILSAFQEDGWPVRVDDPLTPAPTLDIKRRLSDAIKCLNRNQVNQLLHFRGDGTGQAVVWEVAIRRSPPRQGILRTNQATVQRRLIVVGIPQRWPLTYRERLSPIGRPTLHRLPQRGIFQQPNRFSFKSHSAWLPTHTSCDRLRQSFR